MKLELPKKTFHMPSIKKSIAAKTRKKPMFNKGIGKPPSMMK